MDKGRRNFLKLAGISLAGAGLGTPVISAITKTPKAHASSSSTPSQRWAMVIDTTKCMQKDGCTECSKSCHAIHNVPDIGNTKEEVKWIWKEPFKNVFHNSYNPYSSKSLIERPVPILCNHCTKAPCVRVCPAQATWTRKDGIVMMDPHRCIGCRYCVTACPYGARSFNWRDPRPKIKKMNMDYPTRTAGVAEKCNFCAERLVKGLLPMCVETCNKIGISAISFGQVGVNDSNIMNILRNKKR